MNKVQQLLAILALAGISSSPIMGIGSNRFIFSNMIGDPIVLKISPAASNYAFYQIIYPKKSIEQILPGALCLATTGVKWAPLNKTAPFNGGLDFVNPETGFIPDNKQEEFHSKMHNHYVFFPVAIKLLPNDAFKALKSGAVRLLEGIDSFACQTLSEVKAFMNPAPKPTTPPGAPGNPPQKDKTTLTIELLGKLQTILSKVDIEKSTALVKATARNEIIALITKENGKLLIDIGKIDPADVTLIKERALIDAVHYKKCSTIVNRALYTILGLTPAEIEKELQKINKPTQPDLPVESKPTLALKLLGQLHTIIKGIDLEKASAIDKANATNQIVALLSADNMTLLTDIAKLTPAQISSIKGAVATDKAAQEAALSAITSGSDTIAAALQTNIDTNVSINTLMSTGGNAAKCSFGLGLIGKGSAKLAEHTLCTNREFIIYYDINEDDGLPRLDAYGQPVLVAKTSAGQ